MNKEKITIQNLQKVKDIFDKKTIEFWLDEGTLLGAVREKRFIPWDHDADFGTLITSIPKIQSCFEEIQNAGLEILFHPWRKHIKLLSNGYDIDINPYYLKGENATRTWYEYNKIGQILDYIIWTMELKDFKYRKSNAPKSMTKIIMKFGNSLPNGIKNPISKTLFLVFEKIGCRKVPISIPSHFFKNLGSVQFYNMKFQAPKEVEKYLEYRYGKDWKTPKKDYVHTRDDQSIIKK